MKITFWIIVALALSIGLACKKRDVKTEYSTPQIQPTPAPTVSIPKDGEYPGKGKVTKINNTLGSVELDHEEIVGVMAPMIMEFYVSDKAMLKGLEVGDRVDFTLLHKHPTETIVKITKAK